MTAEQVEAILATRRVAPSNKEWNDRIWALSVCLHNGPSLYRDRVSAEMQAMWAARDARRDEQVKRERMFRARDTKTMRNCAYRHPAVRGLTERECKAKRMCFLCAGPLPPRRQWWCSDRCVRLWTTNHEWGSASTAALLRDRGCVRSHEHPGPFEVNHKDPRRGRGYHKGCHHHLRRLETLCRPCHVIETTRQGRERREQGRRDTTDGGSSPTGARLPSTLNMASGLSND